MNSYPPKRKISPFLLLVIGLVVLWWIFYKPQRIAHNPEATPRAVTARGDLAQDERNTIELFQAISPAVVYITSVEFRRGFFSLNVHEIPKGTGSGFVWDKEGRIVTNYHVIEDANQVHVTLSDNTTWKAALVGATPDKDIAVLQINAPAESLQPIPVGESSSLLVGQKVFAIGNPFGLDQTITSGIVSALDREIKSANGMTIHGVIQTDAAINPGNSGGPLLDSAGRLIGVNTAIYSPVGVSAGIGFAVPVDEVNQVVTQIIKYGHIIRPGIGITVVNERVADRLGIEGVLIARVERGSGAEKAGLRGIRRINGELYLGDIIVGMDGTPISNLDELRQELDKHKVGDEVTLKIVRDDQDFQVKVILEQVG
jgi:S1-C subfamily serine protease